MVIGSESDQIIYFEICGTNCPSPNYYSDNYIPGLTALVGPSVPAIIFYATNDTAKAGPKKIRVEWGRELGGPWSASYTATFNYVLTDPCETASFSSNSNSWVTATNNPALLSPIGTARASTSTATPFSTTSSSCAKTTKWAIISKPTDAVHDTVKSKLTVTINSGGSVTISVTSGTIDSEWGFYTLQIQ